ncbi:hypothetical protein CY34DRAFT_801473 [Suillus luteus UH-Slu-Lm8-n1]|uniref:Uncharacterized protein n=1 Tax=Suillus luteus UH-Slu-Lm8-n1 TaxID=930992 RepID=A0A0D0BHJ4_9AGAM|nr:hypothetical protein CY34DRAFT_801473 [Suillus luteus UH-Slu-Lm8-n1]
MNAIGNPVASARRRPRTSLKRGSHIPIATTRVKLFSAVCFLNIPRDNFPAPVGAPQHATMHQGTLTYTLWELFSGSESCAIGITETYRHGRSSRTSYLADSQSSL